MEIKTKFNIDDTVWSVTPTCHATHGKIYQIAFCKIDPDAPLGATTVDYWCSGMENVIYKEDQLCASYEELLQRISTYKHHEQEE